MFGGVLYVVAVLETTASLLETRKFPKPKEFVRLIERENWAAEGEIHLPYSRILEEQHRKSSD